MSAQILKFPDRPYRLEAVKNELTKRLDLKIVNIENGEEKILSAFGDYDSAVFFEISLEKILGGEEAFKGLYLQGTRPKVTRRELEQIYGAYATASVHC